jgi:hypothetical protein
LLVQLRHRDVAQDEDLRLPLAQLVQPCGGLDQLLQRIGDGCDLCYVALLRSRSPTRTGFHPLIVLQPAVLRA